MSNRRIRFADVVIDLRTRELRWAGAPVSVQRKVFDLLDYLVERRDRAVRKGELQDRVWPGMIVTETALTRAVMKARRAVVSHSERQAVIRMVHGHGYHLALLNGDAAGAAGRIAGIPWDAPAPAQGGDI